MMIKGIRKQIRNTDNFNCYWMNYQNTNRIIQIILDYLNIIKDSKNVVGSIIQSDCSKETMILDIQEVSHKQKLIKKDVKDQVGNQLKSFQLQFSEIDQLFSILQNNQIEKNQNEKNVLLNKEIMTKETQMDEVKQFKKLQYDLLKDSIVKPQKGFCSFLFLNDNTLLLFAYENKIFIYEFMNDKIVKQLQILTNHTNFVSCLQPMKKSISFVSGSVDKTIIIWILSQNKTWVAQQVLNEHAKHINSILINKMEDQLISASGDCIMKFWKLMAGSWICQQNLETNYSVSSIGFNEMNDKLIFCENEHKSAFQKSYIQVLIQDNNKQWIKVQTLNFDGLGWRLGFTIGDQFVFTSVNSDLLEIYDYDKSRQMFQKVQQLQIQKIKGCCSDFPCQYIKTLSILTFKHGEFLNIIKLNENYKYELIQTIQFGNQYIFGRMSDDGKYIVTLDSSIQEIQIRKIQYLA